MRSDFIIWKLLLGCACNLFCCIEIFFCLMDRSIKLVHASAIKLSISWDLQQQTNTRCKLCLTCGYCDGSICREQRKVTSIMPKPEQRFVLPEHLATNPPKAQGPLQRHTYLGSLSMTYFPPSGPHRLASTDLKHSAPSCLAASQLKEGHSYPIYRTARSEEGWDF